jgi:hypothetical protein
VVIALAWLAEDRPGECFTSGPDGVERLGLGAVFAGRSGGVGVHVMPTGRLVDLDDATP